MIDYLTLSALLFAGPQATPIVGGSLSESSAWRDSVALLRGHTFVCSGILVARRTVLTAAHCLTGEPPDRVVFGAEPQAEDTVTVSVESVHQYPDWTKSYDLGIVKLGNISHLDVPYRLIARGCALQSFARDAPVVAVGFGSTTSLPQGVQKHEARMSLVTTDCNTVPEASCRDTLGKGAEVIAGGGGVDTCGGDSGGPLYLETPDGHVLLGVTSRALYPAVQCGGGGIYVRLDETALAWLADAAEIELGHPRCLGGTGTSVDEDIQRELNLWSMSGVSDEASCNLVGATPSPWVFWSWVLIYTTRSHRSRRL